jgi:transcriptional regulator with XRE-family HTH domain
MTRDEQFREIHRLAAKGLTYKAIAAAVGVERRLASKVARGVVPATPRKIGGPCKINDDQVRAIRALAAAGLSMIDIAAVIGISRQHARRVAKALARKDVQ